MIIYTPSKPAKTIPVIDLLDTFAGTADQRKAASWQIHKACRDTGFFYVRNHGISETLMRAQLQWTARFFAQPLNEKLAIGFKNSERRMGYEPMLRQILDEGSAPDLKESYMYLGPLGRETYEAVDHHNFWPRALPGFRAQMQTYHTAVGRLGLHLMRLIALSLDLKEDYFDDAYDETTFSVRLLHYPPQPASGPRNQLGAGAETDWGAITLLLQDAGGDLEVRNASGEWISAIPIPGTFLINLGDMMRRWTNDLYQPTLHRVLNKASGQDRYSVLTFFSARQDYRVECVPTCLPAGTMPLYPPCTVAEHTRDMARRTYAA